MLSTTPPPYSRHCTISPQREARAGPLQPHKEVRTP